MTCLQSLREHWPEYLMEAWGLGMFMVSAGIVTVLLEASESPIPELIPDANLRRAIVGMAMGLTAIGIIYSPWGKQSGAHINPAVTLTFLHRVSNHRRHTGRASGLGRFWRQFLTSAGRLCGDRAGA
ncbi:MAG: aquaporin [Methylococcaceae bacterium]|nr:aquaporin [Methylococcaceae bacterium]MDZ4097870.1 aquaporin [Methylophilaceae bacterium]MDP2394336.1 aquaporin [Methylococcaceae bacterium]MDP3020125.1 aquaporin [Methylococcaceae bacterium]MDP3391199.1 aquaporin [Methylococcaceae bacterium]